MRRIRLDHLVVERGLVPSRERARALILAGQVTVDGRPVTKAGTAIDVESVIALVVPDHPYAGRGGLKRHMPSTSSTSRWKDESASTSVPPPAASPT
jgi:predicted rRNA methylase YqxC with S4 and FtsJ domains